MSSSQAQAHLKLHRRDALIERLTFSSSGSGVTCWEGPVFVLAQLADVLKGKHGVNAHQILWVELEERSDVKYKVGQSGYGNQNGFTVSEIPLKRHKVARTK